MPLVPFPMHVLNAAPQLSWMHWVSVCAQPACCAQVFRMLKHPWHAGGEAWTQPARQFWSTWPPPPSRVAVIEPGIVKTAIMAKNVDAPNATGAYDAHYRRLFGFYAAGLETPGHPDEVYEVIYAAATDDPPKFRYTCGWGGFELSTNRAKVSDEDWIALGAIEDDAAYAARFEELFGLKIAQ